MRRVNKPHKILEWCPPGRRRRRRKGNSRMQQVTTGMREKGINSMKWNKIKLEL